MCVCALLPCSMEKRKFASFVIIDELIIGYLYGLELWYTVIKPNLIRVNIFIANN